MSDPLTLPIWPARLDRTSAPELAGANAARVMENIELAANGRMTRRKGVAAVNVDGLSKDVKTMAMVQRGDDTMLLFIVDDAGFAILVTGAAVLNTDLDEFGAIGTTPFNENFAEEAGQS